MHYRLPGGAERETACGRHKKSNRAFRGAVGIRTTTDPAYVTCERCARHRDVAQHLVSTRQITANRKARFALAPGTRLAGFDATARVVRASPDAEEIVIRWDHNGQISRIASLRELDRFVILADRRRTR